jgi:hypothetical protein
MQRFYRVVYRIDKGDDTGSLVERIITAVSQTGSPDHPIAFLFSDAIFGRQRSALEYLVKTYPVFEPYRTTVAGFPTAGASVITNAVSNLSAPQNRVSNDTILDVARGIPRRFAFRMANFTWRNVPGLDLAPEAPPADPTAAGMTGRLMRRTGMPCITLVSSWAASKRGLDLTTVVRLRAESAASRKPELPDATRTLLESIGKRKADDVYALPDGGETAVQTKDALQAVDDVFRRARAELLQRVTQLPLELLYSAPSSDRIHEAPGSVREPLADALSPLGYSPLRGASSPGLLVFAKATADGDELRISVDRGTWSHHFAGRLEIRTEQWIRSMSIPLAPDDQPSRPYPQVDRDQIRRLCTNLAMVAREIETIVYPQVRAALRQRSGQSIE